MTSLPSRARNDKNDKEQNEIIESILSSKVSTKCEFRDKLAQMKLWKPASSPSNRDRLELYALRKQAISGTAPSGNSGGGDDDDDENSTSSRTTTNTTSSSSLADRAKLKAWRSKRGMTQEEAMLAYIMEANRQMQLYGTTTRMSQNAVSTSDDATTTSSSIFFTPRGLAAIPLLCAAASESRDSYITRLSTTTPKNTINQQCWWCRQEPLCADPGTILAIPETFTIWLGTQIESISTITSFKVWHSYLWPLHNVTLVLWMAIIIVSSLLATSYLILQTILYSTRLPTTTVTTTMTTTSSARIGRRKSLSRRLQQILNEEVVPCQRACVSLVQSHQPISVRILGLICIPAVKLCRYATPSNQHATIQAILFVVLSFLSVWYWAFCLTWVASMSLIFAFSIGWCFAIIQLAQDLTPFQ